MHPPPPETLAEEVSLDPGDWGEFRRLGHRMVEDMADWLESVDRRPAWTPMPPSVPDRLDEPLPREPQGLERAYADFRELVLPYSMGNIHPRFWGWVIGTGTPQGMLAEMLAAGMNTHVSFGSQAAVHVELRVVDWLAEMLGYPHPCAGLLVSGCTMATITGLCVARNERSGADVRAAGLPAVPRLTFYGSQETHSSVTRALEVLGLGRDAFRPIPADGDYRVLVPALEERIREDRAAGLRPVCVIGNAGTTNTGSFDDLAALAEVCRREGLWFHVDGAFGAMAALVPGLRRLTAGLDRADSLAFDLHKWMHIPYEAGVVLLKDREALTRNFPLGGAYLKPVPSGVATGPVNFMAMGIQQSRGFRALKVWMMLKEHGVARIARCVERNVEQARALAERIRKEPRLHLAAPVALNVVCFRYEVPGRSPEDLDELNRRLLVSIQENGVAVPSHTVLEGRFVLRVAISNHRTRQEDLSAFVDEILARGRVFEATFRAGSEGPSPSPGNAPTRGATP